MRKPPMTVEEAEAYGRKVLADMLKNYGGKLENVPVEEGGIINGKPREDKSNEKNTK